MHSVNTSAGYDTFGKPDHDLNEKEDILKDADNATRKKSARRLVYFSGACASMISVLLGYNVGVMAEAIIYMRKTMPISSFQSALLVGCLNIVSAFSGFAFGKSSDALGRIKTIALSCVVFFVGAAVGTFSNSYSLLLFGRIIIGVGLGSGFVVVPIYVSEIAPKEIRGMMVAFTDVCINIGILLGFAIGIVCKDAIADDESKWRAMLGIGMLPPIVIIAMLCLIPESPRWLTFKGRDAEAFKVLKQITGSVASAQQEKDAIRTAMGDEMATTSWKEVVCSTQRTIMLPVLLSLALGFIQQVSGTEALIYYSPQILDDAGFPLAGSVNGYFLVIIGLFKVVGELVTVFLVDRFGRKPFLYASAAGVTICMLAIALAFQFRSKFVVAAGICFAMFAFSLGLGSLTFVVAAELNPMQVRGKAMSLTTFVNRITAGVVTVAFFVLVEGMGYPGYFQLYTWMSFLTLFFFIYCLPETGGKELEEIALLFADKPKHAQLAQPQEMDSEVVNYLHSAL